MRILLLTQWYPPEPQEFLAELAHSLRDLGHEVTVLTGFPNWPSGKVYPGYKVRPWRREVMDGVRVVRVALYPDHSRSGLKRMLNYASFALSASVLAPWLALRADVIHVIPPLTSCVPGWLLSRLWKVPFTHEVQDLWPETLAATGMVRSRWVLAMVDRFAKWVYRRAAAVRVISPGFKANLVSKGVPEEKIRVISNWVDTEFFQPLAPDLQKRDELGLTGRFNVMYAGTMGPAQGLDVVLEAADRLRDRPEVQFALAGDGIEAGRLQELVRSSGLTNVRFLGRFPVRDMPALYALADVLLVHLREDPLFCITIPHKIYTCLASGKPLLVAVDGDAAALVAASRSGLACPPGDAAALAGAVRTLLDMSPESRAELGRNARRSACEDFGRDRLVGQIASMLCDVVLARGCGRAHGIEEASGRAPTDESPVLRS